MDYYDAHMHYPGDHPDAERLMQDIGLKGLNIAVDEFGDEQWRVAADLFREMTDRRPELWSWCTTFPAPVEGGVASIIRGLEHDFRTGAVACKVWKDIGLRAMKDGGYLLIDDPLFNPIWDCIEDAGKPVILHIGDPPAAWLPLSDDTPHAHYFRNHPEWHVYGKPGVPSHHSLMASRDRLLADRPGIIFVGAHLGSMADSVSDASDRLRRYENFYVDLSARFPNLAEQETSAVREFFTTFPNRILYGTDLEYQTPFSMMSQADREEAIVAGRSILETCRHYLASTQEEGCLALPKDVLKAVMRDNAIALFER
jgi:predicted TIM-barrel fold metal-dependent hydrolase